MDYYPKTIKVIIGAGDLPGTCWIAVFGEFIGPEEHNELTPILSELIAVIVDDESLVTQISDPLGVRCKVIETVILAADKFYCTKRNACLEIRDVQILHNLLKQIWETPGDLFFVGTKNDQIPNFCKIAKKIKPNEKSLLRLSSIAPLFISCEEGDGEGFFVYLKAAEKESVLSRITKLLEKHNIELVLEHK